MSTRDQQSAPHGAHDAEPRANAASVNGEALQDQIGQALQPAMAVLRDQLTTTVRRELEEKLQHDGRTSQSSTARSGERLSDRRLDSPRQSAPRREDDEDEPRYSDRGATARSRPADNSELTRSLQEQISQALQPAMADFREQMAATVRHELDETLRRERPRAVADTGRTSHRESADEEMPADRDEPRAADRASAKEAGAEDDDRSKERGSSVMRSLLGKPLLAALPEILEQQGEQWLGSQLDRGVDLLFSGWVRMAVQQEIEGLLQRVARVGIALVPDRAAREELGARSEQTVERLVQTALDKLFAEDVREDLKARGHQAIGALLHPDVKSILEQAQELLLSSIEGLIAVLRECWDQIIQLLTRAVLALVQPRLTGILKDTFASLATTSGRDRETKQSDAWSASEEEETERPRAQARRADDVMDDDDDERDRPRSRSQEHEEDAHDNGRRNDRPSSRASAGRSPAGRPSSARPGPGRPTSDRSASGRPSRAASR